MKRTLSRTAHITFVFAAAAVALAAPRTSALAQTRPPETAAPTVVQPAASPRQREGTTADEDFELNIATRRINERDFEASTAVEAGGAQASGLNLRVGVMVRASEIDMLLRGVQGRVRFRASLEPVLRLLNSRRGEPAPTPSPSSPSP